MLNIHRWLRASLLTMPLALFAITAHATADNSLTGNWARSDGATRIDIVQCGSAYCATNTWVKNPSGPEKLGDKLILNVKPISSTELQGQAYDVRRKSSYKMTIKLQGTTMQTQGCVLDGLLCKAANWTRTS